MMMIANGGDRTFDQFYTLLHSTGWKIVNVGRSLIGSFLPVIEAVPI
jgi:hypothetical protein